MGLDIMGPTHSFRAGSYSGFNDFRNWLARQLGFNNLDDYYHHYEPKAGKWLIKQGLNEGVDKIPLGALMFHSDCDGLIATKYLPKLLKDLKRIKKNLAPDADDLSSEAEWYREKLADWIKVTKGTIECEGTIEFG